MKGIMIFLGNLFKRVKLIDNKSFEDKLFEEYSYCNNLKKI